MRRDEPREKRNDGIEPPFISERPPDAAQIAGVLGAVDRERAEPAERHGLEHVGQQLRRRVHDVAGKPDQRADDDDDRASEIERATRRTRPTKKVRTSSVPLHARSQNRNPVTMKNIATESSRDCAGSRRAPASGREQTLVAREVMKDDGGGEDAAESVQVAIAHRQRLVDGEPVERRVSRDEPRDDRHGRKAGREVEFVGSRERRVSKEGVTKSTERRLVS